MIYRIIETEEYLSWLQKQSVKTQLIVNARFTRLQAEGHWGFVNRFDDLIELKWPSGMRIYTALIDSAVVIILGGGNKNGQKKDIKETKKILWKKRQGI